MTTKSHSMLPAGDMVVPAAWVELLGRLGRERNQEPVPAAVAVTVTLYPKGQPQVATLYWEGRLCRPPGFSEADPFAAIPEGLGNPEGPTIPERPTIPESRAPAFRVNDTFPHATASDPDAALQELRAAVWSHVAVGGPAEHWRWLGPIAKGDPVFQFLRAGKRSWMSARKAIWILTYGSMQNGYPVRCQCGAEHCVNPEHLVLAKSRSGEIRPLARPPVLNPPPRAPLMEPHPLMEQDSLLESHPPVVEAAPNAGRVQKLERPRGVPFQRNHPPFTGRGAGRAGKSRGGRKPAPR